MNPVIPMLALGAASFVMVTLPTFLRNVLPQSRIRYRDGLYFISVRNGEWLEIREFVQPHNPDIVAIVNQIIYPSYSENTLWDWVCSNIDYRKDVGEFFQFPTETLRGYGDCEDSTLLLVSMLRQFYPAQRVYAILGSYRGYGHAWCQLDEQILETTYTRAQPAPDPDNYCPYVMFNDLEVRELWPGALADVFTLGRNEAAKIDLMAATLGT